jgi:DNA mismatch repair protein MutS
MATKSGQLTPMMKQYWEIKSRYPDKDTILFFRLGDFYEMFFDDAEVASGILDIALTSRNKNDENPVPLCGIPFHSAEGYITKLLTNGKKVAICEQVEDPAMAKGIVKRDVIRVITPGVITEASNLDAERHNFLVALNLQDKRWGFAVVDVSTGLFKATEFSDIREIAGEISRLEPAEIIISRTTEEAGLLDRTERILKGVTFTVLDDPKFDPEKLSQVVGTDKAAPIPALGKSAAGGILNYIEYTAKEILKHIGGVEQYEPQRFMIIDEATKRNLELTKTMIDGTRFGSLLWLMDQSVTPMGARLLREWLLHPLVDPAQINERLDAVSVLYSDLILSDEIAGILKGIGDMERTAGRLAMETANARDLASLKKSLKHLPQLIDIKTNLSGLLKNVLSNIDPLNDVVSSIETTLSDEPPLSLREGGIIKEGASRELDELRAISGEGKGFIATLEAEEKKKTGITTLKVRFNRVFGYYIEVTNMHKARVPETYIRKQTLANAERYITPELKSFEEKVLGAEEKIKALEFALFSKLRIDLAKYVQRIKLTAGLLAKLDTLLSLASVARTNRYVRPDITESADIEIKEGRHPIIERISKVERFIPNDTLLTNSTDRLIIITGPNMAGKSTVMRQVALITLMAQMGSFVPAGSAKIGVVDRIFTRVGASDNIMRGQSTFMVEMQEAASILNDATERSLIIIDEIGRGTSTFDGLAIAWAVAEYIHDKIKAKTLFATHYHELTDLVRTKKSAKNFNIAVKEWNDKIIFLHKLVPGGVNHSYGIQVAQLAGLPQPIVERSREILANLESGELDEVGQPRLAYSKQEKAKKRAEAEKNQLQLFHQDSSHKVVQELKKTNVDTMSPIEALNLLHKLKSEV